MDLFSEIRGMKILLIDDDEWIRDSLRIFFEAEGCHILALETAEEVLTVIEDQIFDLIIVDYKLPGMDGIEFLKRISGIYETSFNDFLLGFAYLWLQFLT